MNGSKQKYTVEQREAIAAAQDAYWRDKARADADYNKALTDASEDYRKRLVDAGVDPDDIIPF